MEEIKKNFDQYIKFYQTQIIPENIKIEPFSEIMKIIKEYNSNYIDFKNNRSSFIQR